MPDDAVVEQLQTAMTELRSKKLDQPPPGAPMFFYRPPPPPILSFFVHSVCLVITHKFCFLFLAKSDELPKKPLGQERPVLLLPLQPDSSVKVKISPQSESQPSTDTQETVGITPHQPPSLEEPQESRSLSRPNTPSLPSPDPVVVHTQGTPSSLRPCRNPPIPPKVGVRRDVKELFPAVSQERGNEENETSVTEIQEEPVDWPPPYEPPPLDMHTMEAEEEIMDLPDLPPPPFIFPNQIDQMPLGGCSPHLGARTGPGIQQCSHSPRSASPLVNQIKLSPKLYPKPPTSLDILQKKSLPSKPSPNRAFTDSSSSPRIPPKPTKFPVSLYVPVSAGDRRPSNTSQYDNLSEVDEDDRNLERVLSSTPEEIPSLHNNPSYNREYDPAVYPLPPPPVYMHHSASPPSLCALPSLPQEPEYVGEGSWVEDPILAPPPPSFADRLSPLQCTTASCSDPHKAMSPGYSKPFSRGPRDHSAFPAPLLYTGSPPTHLRSSGQSEVGVALVQSSPDFCRVPQSGHQLPKSVTF